MTVSARDDTADQQVLSETGEMSVDERSFRTRERFVIYPVDEDDGGDITVTVETENDSESASRGVYRPVGSWWWSAGIEDGGEIDLGRSQI